MKVLTTKEIRKVIRPIWHQDHIQITQKFGNKSDRYSSGFHTGVDTAVFDRIVGEELKSPFDGIIQEVSFDYRTGWKTIFDSGPLNVNGVGFKLEWMHLHTRKPFVSVGDRVRQGDIFAKAGIVLTPNRYWTGQHTHTEILLRYRVDGGWLPDYNNGYLGRINPQELIEGYGDIAELQGKDIKSSLNPDVFLINGNKRYKYPDEAVYSAKGRIFGRDLYTVNQSTMAQFQYGGEVEIDFEKNEAAVTKQLLGLLKNNPKRAEELLNKYF